MSQRKPPACPVLKTFMQVTIQHQTARATAGVWFTRVIVFVAAALFVAIGTRGILDPTGTAVSAGIQLGPGKAMSVARASFGAFPLGLAIYLLISLFSKNGLYRGILAAFVIIAVTTLVRAIGYTIDGVAPFLLNEILLTVLSGTALMVESRRMRILAGGH